jgi:magnesium transporter
MTPTTTHELRAELRRLLSEGQDSAVVDLLEGLHSADVAEIAQELEIPEVLAMLQLLPAERWTDILVYFDDELQSEILENFTGKEIAEVVLENIDSDDAADLMADLSEEKKREVLQNIEDVEYAKDLADLLTHAEGTAGALMATEMVQVNENWTVSRCVREMRRQAEEVEVVHAVYVIDDHDILLGSLSLKKLLTTGARTPIADVYDRSVRSVTSTTDEVEVARIMKKYDLVVLPVVDDLGRLLGRITIDDVVDVIQEEADSNYQLLSGLSEEVDHDDNLLESTRARLPWLLVGLVGGLVSSTVISSNESQLVFLPQMAFFIPLIAAMGGNVGVQSSAIVVQALANQTLNDGFWQRIFKELRVGLFNGLIFGALILIYGWAAQLGLQFSLTVALSLLAVVVFASLFGTAVPWLLHQRGIDPALATGPFITTTNDVLGLTIYFAIARGIFGF